MKSLIILVLVISLKGINSHSTTVNEGEHGHIQCGQNELIYVEYGEWTYQMLNWRNGFIPNWRNFFYWFGKPVGMCTYDVTEAVNDICHGKNECKIDGDRITLHNDECNYWMKLIVTYECVDCSQFENRYKRSLSPISGDDHQLERFKRQNEQKLNSFCLAFAFAYMVFNNNNNRRRYECPHYHFVKKHLCEDCTNENDVIDFAKKAYQYRIDNKLLLSNINSVFIGRTGYNRIQNNCRFKTALPKYQCVYKYEIWRCVKQERNARALHNIYTGHYEYNSDI